MTSPLSAITNAKNAARTILGLLTREPGTAVDVEKIAGVLSIKIDYFDGEKISGFLTRDGEKAEIFLNRADTEKRKRFTIAHEIGHFCLHALESMHVDDRQTAQPVYFRDEESSKATKIKEIEANQFAAELLMPSDEIRSRAKELMQNNKSVEDVVEQMAETYNVSTAAMAIKVAGVM